MYHYSCMAEYAYWMLPGHWLKREQFCSTLLQESVWIFVQDSFRDHMSPFFRKWGRRVFLNILRVHFMKKDMEWYDRGSFNITNILKEKFQWLADTYAVLCSVEHHAGWRMFEYTKQQQFSVGEGLRFRYNVSHHNYLTDSGLHGPDDLFKKNWLEWHIRTSVYCTESSENPKMLAAVH